MSTSKNWHCDLCSKHWNHQHFHPKDLVGFSQESKLVPANSEKTYKHICKDCLKAIAKGVEELSSPTMDFANLNDYYSQESFDERGAQG